MKIIKNSISLMTLSVVVLFAEPSMYGNGMNDDISKLQTKNKNAIYKLKHKIEAQNERIDGLMSVVEGLSSTVNDLRQSKHSKPSQGEDTILLKDLGKMIDKINSDYVSKAEFNEALNLSPTLLLREKKNVSDSPIKTSKKKASLSRTYTQGVKLFSKGRYREAKDNFMLTDEKGYKSAASNYYLGEISYYTKQYEEAIFYFKKSAGLNDNASYIDTLLLHTGVSLEKNGEIAKAKAFYENIIVKYRNSKSASIAKNKLKKLK